MQHASFATAAVACLVSFVSAQQAPVLWSNGSAVPGAAMGHSVTALEDVNRDGKKDFAVGIPADNPRNLAASGSCYLYSGKDGSVIRQLHGRGANDLFGESCAGLGDVNGDGFPDVLVGATEGRHGGAGYARVHSGKDGTVIHRWDGAAAGHAFGTVVARLGDVNGNGIDDVAVLATSGKTAGGSGGYVRVFDARTGARIWQRGFLYGGTPSDIVAVGDTQKKGYANVMLCADLGNHSRAQLHDGRSGALIQSFNFGASACSVGDVDKDGHGDFALSAPHDASNRGSVHIVSGRTYAILRTMVGDLSGDYFGALVRTGHDLDRDGAPEVIIGKRSRGTFVRSSKTGRQFFWCKPAANYGRAAAAIDDMNGDGHGDYLCGNSPENGARGAARVISGYWGLPDLRCEGTGASPASALAGTNVSFSSKTTNRGTASAGPFRVGMYLSKDDKLSSGDAHLGDIVYSSGLKIGSGALSITVKVPALTPGAYRILAHVDRTGAVEEWDETNNVFAGGTFTVEPPPAADLRADGLSSAATTATPGQPFTFTTRIGNIGRQNATGFRTRFYLSTDTTLSSGDIYLGNVAIAGLSTGAATSRRVRMTIPATAKGHMHLLMFADGTQAINEEDETNNVASLPVSVGVPPAPDLTIRFFHNTLLTQSGTVRVLCVVKNVGTAPSVSTDLTGYLRTATSAPFTPATVPALDAGEEVTLSVSARVPSNFFRVSGYVLVVDAANKNTEISESNNSVTRSEGSVPISRTTPFAMARTAVLDRTRVECGGALQVTATLEKRISSMGPGGGNAAIQLLRNSVAIATLGTVHVRFSLSSLTAIATETVAIPVGLPAGTYEIAVLAGGRQATRAFTVVDRTGPARLSTATGPDPDRTSISATSGGTASFRMHAPARAGRWALTLWTLDPALRLDALSMFGLQLSNGPALPGWLTRLGSTGVATPRMNLPPLPLTSPATTYVWTRIYDDGLGLLEESDGVRVHMHR